jgi:hypothetical protein
MTVAWSSWKPSPALRDYVFEDRAEHERAFRWAEQVSPQPSIDEADNLPLLPFTSNVLMAPVASDRSRSYGLRQHHPS